MDTVLLQSSDVPATPPASAPTATTAPTAPPTTAPTTSAAPSYLYPTDVFLKYRDVNRKGPPNFDKYYNDNSQNKIRRAIGLDMLEKQDVRMKLNYIITKRN